MKKIILGFVILLIAFVSCSKEEKEGQGQLSFASNFHVINTPLKVSIYIDGEYVGRIVQPSENIKKCGIIGNVTKDVTVGKHTYTYEVVNDPSYNNEEDTIVFTFNVKESKEVNIEKDECQKVFIDVREMPYTEE